jgi:hypothetical protein
MLLHYGVLVLAVTERYKYINYVFVELLETRIQPTRFSKINAISAVGSHAGNYMKPASYFKSQNILCKPDAIRTLHLIYLELYDATKLVSTHFEVSVVFATVFIRTYCVSAVHHSVYEPDRASADDGTFRSYLDFAYYIYECVLVTNFFL